MATITKSQQKQFSEMLDKVSLELYSKDAWKVEQDNYDKLGLMSPEFDMMLTHTHDILFERHPHLFDGMSFIESECGMPLWVRPGVEWIPSHEREQF